MGPLGHWLLLCRLPWAGDLFCFVFLDLSFLIEKLRRTVVATSKALGTGSGTGPVLW